jgi:DNA helicase IV
MMQKSFNFSVPGSGKTSVVLAIFAFLNYKKKAKKILIIGPLSSLKS